MIFIYRSKPSKQDTLYQNRSNAGPETETLYQHWSSTGPRCSMGMHSKSVTEAMTKLMHKRTTRLIHIGSTLGQSHTQCTSTDPKQSEHVLCARFLTLWAVIFTMRRISVSAHIAL